MTDSDPGFEWRCSIDPELQADRVIWCIAWCVLVFGFVTCHAWDQWRHARVEAACVQRTGRPDCKPCTGAPVPWGQQ
jgi:hypothetical protein